MTGMEPPIASVALKAAGVLIDEQMPYVLLKAISRPLTCYHRPGRRVVPKQEPVWARHR
jgi:hypothetical protein